MGTDSGTVVDADVVETDSPQSGVAMAVRAEPAALTVNPQTTAADLVGRLKAIEDAMKNAMVTNVDYGVIPGTDKPTLYKPGAEKLAAMFQLDVQFRMDEAWGPGDHLRVNARSTVFHAPTGARLGAGEGLCTTRERKYAYRKAERACPDCGAVAVIKGKEEFGGGWLCFTKKGGCNAKWPDSSDQGKAFASLTVGDVENPDLPDSWNTVLKMAKKRALVDAVLVVTGASAIFTQDAEDLSQDQRTTIEPKQPQQQTGTRGITARPAQRTERMATAKQRGLVNARASAKGLPPMALASIVLAANGSEPRAFDSQSAAEDWLRRSLDRLPGRLIDPILEGIAAAESEAE